MTDWEVIVRQQLEAVRRTVYRLVGNDADAWDCIQETFLEAVKIDRREPIRDVPRLLQHLATIRALDLLRKRYRQHDRPGLEFDPAIVVGREPEPPEQAEATELAANLRLAVCRLPQRQAKVFCLSCLELMSSEEIAEQLGLNAAAVRMLLSRARERLKRLLSPFAVPKPRD